MTLLAILGIIDKVLELSLIYARDLPVESKAAFWERHEQRMAFWTGLAQKFTSEPQP